MSNWTIAPYQGVGSLSFGMSRSQVREILGENVESYDKTSTAQDIDSFDTLGIHAYYDSHDKLEFVELFAPCDPDFAAFTLIGKRVLKIVDELASIGCTCRRDEPSYFVDDSGFALFVEDEIVVAVSVFRKGYYDE